MPERVQRKENPPKWLVRMKVCVAPYGEKYEGSLKNLWI